MQPLQKIFIGFVAFCATLGAAVGVLLYIAATPYIWLIGKFVAGLLITILVCVSCYSVVWTFSQMSIQLSKRRNAQLRKGLITHGDLAYHVFEAPMPPERIYDASAKHVAAGVPRMLPAAKDEKLHMDDETIIDMAKEGLTLMQIVEAGKPVDLKYNRVQSVVAAAKKRGEIR